MTAEPTMHLQQQRFRLRAWIRTRLWAQVVAGMLLGLAAGIPLGPDKAGFRHSARRRSACGWRCRGIVGGLTGAASGSELRSVGLRFAAFVMAATIAAAWTGIGLALWLEPGAPLARSWGCWTPCCRSR